MNNQAVLNIVKVLRVIGVNERILRAAILMVFSILASAAFTTVAQAGHPYRGPAKWSVLLCRYTDSPSPVRSMADMRDLLVNSGTGGMSDFYMDTTRGSVTMAGTTVSGLFTIPMTIAEAAKISNGGPGGNRGLSFQKCVDAAAAAGTTVPAGNMTMVVTTPEVDLWGGGGGRAFMAVDKEIAAFAHEVSHGIGLEHSHSTNVSGPCGGGPDEYHDPFDVMSWACTTRGTQTPRFGSGGPAFNAFQMDRMGWLGRSEILVFGAGGTTSNTITVTALYKPGAGGTRLVRIPFDASDLNRYFTVELRMPLNWDAGIGPPIVVLHESRWDPVHSQFRSYLIRGSLDGPAAQTLNANGVTINVQSIDPASQTAQVQITSQLATQCVLGFVWREAGPGDHVCVTGLAREAARAENQLADSRRSPNGGPSGPNTCKQGFVWREAFPGDQVCVPGTARSRVRGENTVGPSVVNPARFAFGPNTCKLGFVHREGDDKDWVCVSGTTRTETRTENSLGPSRTVAGSDACKQGFVWREAFPGDKTCVPGTSRTRARTDNAAADSRRIAF